MESVARPEKTLPLRDARERLKNRHFGNNPIAEAEAAKRCRSHTASCHGSDL